MTQNFIYQIDKDENETQPILKIYKYDENLKTIIEEIKYYYTIFIKESDFKKLNIESDSIFLSNKKFLNKNKEKVVKVEIKDKELYNYILKSLRELEIITYEGDILLQHQYLIENNINISNFKHNIPKPKTIYLDIESIGDEIDDQEIILLSTYSPESDLNSKVYINLESIHEKNKKKVLNGNFKDFKPIYCENEKELLEVVQKDIVSYSPQVILGWNVIDFDFKIIKQRMEKYNLSFSFSKIAGDAKMRLSKDFFSKSSLGFPGVIVFDVIHLLKTNFISFEDFKLNTVAKEVLDDEKIDLEDEESDNNIESKIKAIKNLLDKNPIKLIEYNFKDSLLTGKIVEKLKLLDLMIERSVLTNTPLLKVQSPIATLDLMYLKKLRIQGKVADSNFNFNETKPIEGAYVLTPKPGFYSDIFVYDFKSLYPSIITTFNIDPFTISEDGEIIAPNNIKFHKNSGILPSIIEMLSKERTIAKSQKNNIKSHAIKITMNSFYGAMASPKSRFYNKGLAEAITAFGREIIKKAKRYSEEKGNNVAIYGDSVTGDTKIKIKKSINGEIEEINIEDLFSLKGEEIKKIQEDGSIKIYLKFKNLFTLTMNDHCLETWEKLDYVVKHKTSKKIYRVYCENGSFVNVTEDHSLIDFNKDKGLFEIKPEDANKIIYFNGFESKNNGLSKKLNTTKIIKKEILENYNDFVFDLCVQKTHRFYGNNILLKNTDSIFISPKKKLNSIDEKIKFGNQIETELNKYFSDWVRKEFNQKNFLQIELEKIFLHFFIASKKRYVGYDLISKKTIFTGMEAIRGDWTELAKNFQIDLINLIFNGGDKEKIKQYILKEIKKLKAGEYDGLLIYKKKITKPLEEYTKTTPPHVKAARELDYFQSKLVKYVITKSGPKHISLINNDVKYDYEHYIEKQLKGVSDDILKALDIDFDEVVFKNKQKDLNSFF